MVSLFIKENVVETARHVKYILAANSEIQTVPVIISLFFNFMLDNKKDWQKSISARRFIILQMRLIKVHCAI
jgi:hypothetical protein